MSEAIFQHDCGGCVLIQGGYRYNGNNGERGIYDLYFCKQGALGRPTVIARFGNEGHEYSSGIFSRGSGPLAIAIKKSIKLGLIKEGDGTFGKCDLCKKKIQTFGEYCNGTHYCTKCKRKHTWLRKNIKRHAKKEKAKQEK